MRVTLQEAICQKYIAPTEREPGKHVGVELEFPLVNLFRRPVNIPAVQEVVTGFAERFGFTQQTRDDNGYAALDTCIHIGKFQVESSGRMGGERTEFYGDNSSCAWIGIVKKCAVRKSPKSVIDRYQAAW